MGLYEDELRKLTAWRAQQNAINKANQAQLDYETGLASAYKNAEKAQSKKTNPLESVVGGVVNSVKNTGKGLFDLFGSGAASIGDLAELISTGKLGTREEDFKKWLYNTDNIKDARLKSAGTSLDAAATLADLISGVGAAGKAAINVGQGVASGIGQTYADSGASTNLEDALKAGTVGGLSSFAGGAAAGGLGKVAGNGKISKALTSQVGKGAISGGVAGGVAGGVGTALNGGNLGEVLANTAGGIGTGALGGGAMAGTMGLLGNATEKLNDRILNKGATAKVKTQNAKIATPDAEVKTEMAKVELDPKKVAKLERQVTVNKQRQGSALLDQYGPLDKPTRRAVGAPEEVLVNLYDDYGLTTPADVQYAANHVTGKDGLVSQMTRELAGKAEKVNTSIDQRWLDEMMDLNGLTDAEAKTVTNQVKAALKRTTVDGYADGNTALDVIKQLEKQASRYKGKDNTYHNSTPSDQSKGAVLDLVRDELQGRIWDAAGDASSVMTPDRIETLKGMYPDNQKWANKVDQIAQVKTGAELRSSMKPLVDGAKIVSGSKLSAGGFADRALKVATSRNPAIAAGQVAADMALDSDFVKQKMADRYAKKAAKANAQLNGEAPGKASVVGSKIAEKVTNIPKKLNNDFITSRAIGGSDLQLPSVGEVMTSQIPRQAGLSVNRNMQANRELEQARNEAMDAETRYQTEMQAAQQAYEQAQQMQQEESAGQQQLDYIANAMQQAMNMGDITSYAKLLDLYQKAYKLYGAQETQTEPTKLTDNQAKALTGIQQLNDLSAMTPDTGTAIADSPLGFLVNLTGGNDYANQAESLALTLGYLQSGANVSKDEAIRIGKSYVPTAYDSEDVRRNKLQRAKALLNNYLYGTQYYQA